MYLQKRGFVWNSSTTSRFCALRLPKMLWPSTAGRTACLASNSLERCVETNETREPPWFGSREYLEEKTPNNYKEFSKFTGKTPQFHIVSCWCSLQPSNINFPGNVGCSQAVEDGWQQKHEAPLLQRHFNLLDEASRSNVLRILVKAHSHELSS